MPNIMVDFKRFLRLSPENQLHEINSIINQ